MIPKNITDIEIMAPVGNFETLSAALEAKADSIYFGIGNLNMRSHSAVNFSINDLDEIIERCHSQNTKCYLTLNTIIYPEDTIPMQEILSQAKKKNVDAIIASDFAVMEEAKKNQMPVHISTQANICNIDAIRHYAQYADVMVLARELNLHQVETIARQIRNDHLISANGKEIRLEMFCHGALCMAVSGKCYLSLDNANKSANRGACIQICRRSYEVRDKETGDELEIDNKYILSPKDLCTIHFLNKILEAGVKVLKIEGRARDSRYVYTTVSCYKEAVQAWRKGEFENDKLIKEKIANWKNRLSSVFNRGFWDGYYLGQRLGEWTHTYGNQATISKVYAGKCTNFFKNLSVAEFKVEAIEAIYENDNLFITGKTTGAYEIKAQNMHNESGNICSCAKQNSLFAIKTDRTVHRGDKLFKLIKPA